MFCSAGIEPSLVVSSSSRQLGDEHPNPKSIFGRCLQIPIEPCWHLNLNQTSQMDKVDARMIFVSKDINIHIPARSCYGTFSHPELVQDPVDRQGENWSSEMIVEGCR